MRYITVLKNGSFAQLRDCLFQLLPAFGIFNSRFYAHQVLLQMALFKFWEYHGHPVMKMLEQYPHMMSGENIELLNGLLSQHTVQDSRRSELAILDPAYKNLGMMLQNGVLIQEDLGKVISLERGKGHFSFSDDDDPRITETTEIFMQVLDSMEEGT